MQPKYYIDVDVDADITYCLTVLTSATQCDAHVCDICQWMDSFLLCIWHTTSELNSYTFYVDITYSSGLSRLNKYVLHIYDVYYKIGKGITHTKWSKAKDDGQKAQDITKQHGDIVVSSSLSDLRVKQPAHKPLESSPQLTTGER